MFVCIPANTREKHLGFVPEEAGLRGSGRGATASTAVGFPTFQSSAHRFVLGDGVDSANPAASSSPTKGVGVSLSSERAPPDLHSTASPSGSLDAMVRRECGQRCRRAVASLECEIASRQPSPFLGGARVPAWRAPPSTNVLHTLVPPFLSISPVAVARLSGFVDFPLTP